MNLKHGLSVVLLATTQQTGVGRLIRQPPNRREAQID